MDVRALLDNVQDLTDLELAVFLSLVAREHCLLTADDALIDDVASELALIVSERFGLSYVVLESEHQTSVDTFGEAILGTLSPDFSSERGAKTANLHDRLVSVNFKGASISQREDSILDDRMVVNVIIAKGFHTAPESVQVQALELIRKGRIFSRTTVHIVPKTFLFLPITPASVHNPCLTPHLNDRIFISHEHDVQDGFANLEELEESESSDRGSRLSHQFSPQDSQSKGLRINSSLIDKVRSLGEATTITAEVRRYMQDIVTFLRLERGVDGGITPCASNQFVALAKYLAPFHGLNFVTPALVTLAARKVYPHRVIIAKPARERSMQYGSDLDAIEELIDGLTPQAMIESVLNTVPCPV